VPVDTDLQLDDGQHVVQFYAADGELVDAVGAYLRGALVAGDSAIVIASPEHRDAFEAHLIAAGVDVELARAREQLLLVDAADTLARFMVDDRPDPVAFDAVVGELVRASGARGPVRAYGEMVALLWDAGLVNAAIEVEELWNGLGEQTSFALFCAYPDRLLSEAGTDDDFLAVCHLHSEVIAGAPVPDGCEVTRRFPRAVQSPALARHFVADTLGSWGMASLVDDAILLVSELAANAVLHATSDFTVGLSRSDAGVRLHVGDASSAVPVARHPRVTDIGGRGLLLMGELAEAVWYELVDGGKVVWVDLTS
jgi:anti-sigma regulatory factor (Ser/Thr protein kinase)